MLDSTHYLHRAAFVVPMSSSADAPLIIEDGAVLTENGRIKEVGRFADLKGVEAEAEIVDHEGKILTPALVNCHTHLELSHLAELAQEDNPHKGDLTAWIRTLLSKRFAKAEEIEDNKYMAWQALARLYASGCRATADIGNLATSAEIGENFKVKILFFLEMLGLGGEEEENSLTRLSYLDDEVRATAHAPYSTSAALIRRLKERSRGLAHLFPIHVAESQDEIDMLMKGRGRMRDFLEERGAWSSSFTVPGCGPVSYLDTLKVLDAQTMCVHCVHVTEAEIDLLARRQSKVCLCPRSNRYLGMGVAPLEIFLDKGILPGLGTDSLASNFSLSLWREMKALLEDHPATDPAVIFRMATRQGAENLGLETEMGMLSPGCSASFLAVESPAKKTGDVFAYLVSGAVEADREYVE